jgi:hypothetical protein
MLLNANCYKIMSVLLLTIVVLPVDFLFYKYVLRYGRDWNCPVPGRYIWCA